MGNSNKSKQKHKEENRKGEESKEEDNDVDDKTVVATEADKKEEHGEEENRKGEESEEKEDEDVVDHTNMTTEAGNEQQHEEEENQNGEESKEKQEGDDVDDQAIMATRANKEEEHEEEANQKGEKSEEKQAKDDVDDQTGMATRANKGEEHEEEENQNGDESEQKQANDNVDDQTVMATEAEKEVEHSVSKDSNMPDPHSEKHEPLESTVTIQIPSMPATVQFNVKSDITGRQLFDLLIDRLELQKDRAFFGLKYTNRFEESAWVEMDNIILSFDYAENAKLAFHFHVRVFPEDPVQEVSSDETLCLIYREAKASINVMSEHIALSTDGLIRLSAYALHIEQGPHRIKDHMRGSIYYQPLIKNHLKGDDSAKIEQKLASLHQDFATNLNRTQAMREFLNAAYALNVYGNFIFKVSNNKWHKLLLSISPQGIALFREVNAEKKRFQLEVRHPWSEVSERPPSFQCGKLELFIKKKRRTVSDAEHQALAFRCKMRDNRQIVALIVDYMARFKPEGRRDAQEKISLPQKTEPLQEKTSPPEKKTKLVQDNSPLQERSALSEKSEQLQEKTAAE